ncbi:UNVERIFIED_CONTAM: hypothetical protein K2H54_052306 [Gekko kuhli]
MALHFRHAGWIVFFSVAPSWRTGVTILCYEPLTGASRSRRHGCHGNVQFGALASDEPARPQAFQRNRHTQP